MTIPRDRITFGAFYTGPSDHTHVIQFAQRIEELGFDAFWTYDRPTSRGPAYDPLVVMTYAAAATERITVGSAVALLPLFHPVRLAMQLASLDNLSGGRVIFGLGVGGEFPKQFEAFGIPVNERGHRTDEYIEVMKALWTQPLASYRGRFYRFEEVTFDPKPIQKPHIPIWIGGRPSGMEIGPDGKPRLKGRLGAMRRAARYGDGWLPYYMTVEMYRQGLSLIQTLAQEFGRDLSGMTLGLNNMWLIRDTLRSALHEVQKRSRYGRETPDRIAQYDFLGAPNDIISRLEEYAAAGARHFICNWSCDPTEIPEHLEIISRRIIPHFR